MTQQTAAKYRIRNWGEYNKALVQRGSLTIWFSKLIELAVARYLWIFFYPITESKYFVSLSLFGGEL